MARGSAESHPGPRSGSVSDLFQGKGVDENEGVLECRWVITWGNNFEAREPMAVKLLRWKAIITCPGCKQRGDANYFDMDCEEYCCPECLEFFIPISSNTEYVEDQS